MFLDKYEQFLNWYRHIQEQESRLASSKFNDFLVLATPILQRRFKERQTTALRFNIFSALRLSSLEQYHSLLLAFLLDPRASHDQGDRFLCGFVETVLGLPCISESTSNTVVITEESAQSFGRLDIKLYLPHGRILIIENKVYAAEGNQQLARYEDWLKIQPRPQSGEHVLVFLTPEGRKPQTSIAGTVVCVSYRTLGDWLSAILVSLPLRLQMVLGQYIEICYAIGGERMRPEMMNELDKLLYDPEKLEVALDVSEAVAVIRKQIPTEFWGNVRNILDFKLKQSGEDVKWEIYMDNDVWESFSKLGLVWKTRKKGSLQFAFLFECLAGKPTYYGITRGKQIATDLLAAEDKILAEELTKEKCFSRSSWWPGYQNLWKLNLNQFNGDKKENTLALHKDNLSETHPLADAVASLLWDLFSNYRLRLENLNERYPY